MTLQRTFQRAALCCALAIFTLLPASRCQALITGFGDIDYWVGSGTNQAALVIDWNDGIAPVSLAWGFQWDGAATGWEMLTAIAAADSRLTLMTHPNFDAIFALYYDVTGTNAGFVAGTPGDLGGPENGAANNPGDHYAEGWYSGYWAYSLYGGDFEYDIYDNSPPYDYIGPGTYDVAGSTTYPVTWESGNIGAGSRDLANGYWDAWSFNGGNIDQPTAAAIPEPTTLLLTALAGGFLALRRRARTDS